MKSLRFAARSKGSDSDVSQTRRRRRMSSRDPFWRNRKSFSLVVIIGLLASSILAGSVYAAPPGETSYWHLDDGVGTVATDASANAFDGVVTGATWDTGVIGTALDFTGGANERVVVNEPANELDLGADQDLSVSLWFNTSATPVAGDEWSLVRRMDSTTGDGYRMFLEGTTPVLKFVHVEGASVRETSYATPLNDGCGITWWA